MWEIQKWENHSHNKYYGKIQCKELHVFFLGMKLILGFRGSCNCRSAPLNISSISAHSYFKGNISEKKCSVQNIISVTCNLRILTYLETILAIIHGSLLFWLKMWTIFQKNVLLFVQTHPTKLCSEFSSIS